VSGVAAAEEDQGEGEGGGGVEGEYGQAGPGGQGGGVLARGEDGLPGVAWQEFDDCVLERGGERQQQCGQDEDQSDQGRDGAGAAADDGAQGDGEDAEKAEVEADPR
jgi:hypothetical protein